MQSPVATALSAVAIASVMSLGAGGNLAVICGLAKFRRVGISPYYFIITVMAGIDLLVCLLDAPIYAAYMLNGFAWPLPQALCKPYLIADYLLCSMSSYCVAALSYDRSVLVLEPLRYHELQSRRRVLGILAGCLVLANFHTPLLLLWPAPSPPGNSSSNNSMSSGCSAQYAGEAGLQLGGVLVQFLLPFAATLVSSCLVHRRMSRRRRRLVFGGGVAGFSSATAAVAASVDKASRRAGRWLILFNAVYTAMWLPCMTMVIVRTVLPELLFAPGRPMFHVFQASWWLLLCNSAVNPFLYMQSCDAMCNYYLRLLCCCCPCTHSRLGRQRRADLQMQLQLQRHRHHQHLLLLQSHRPLGRQQQQQHHHQQRRQQLLHVDDRCYRPKTYDS